MKGERDGGAGASARREYERRRDRDQGKIREKWGPLGGVAVALSDERQSTSAWDRGAVGEQRVGAALDRIQSETVRVLHDRRIPGSRANIDHLVVTRDGVWVIDTKRYKGQRPSLRVEGGLFRPRTESLVVAGRDQTKLLTGVSGQVDRVVAVVPGIPVRGVLCFVDADWPLLGGDFEITGVQVCWPNRLVKTIAITCGGTVDAGAVADQLAARFRHA